MSVSYWQDDGRGADEVAVEVLVVGGGIAGWSTAYWLRESGLDVAVVDQGDICAGASGRNAGFVTCGSVEHYSRQVDKYGAAMARGLWRYSEDNIRLIREEIVEKAGHDCEFRQAGTYSLASTGTELDELLRCAELMRAEGIGVSVVDERHIAEQLGARGFSGGVLYHDDGEVHPVKLVRAIASESGATFYPHHEVFSFDEDGDDVLVQTRCRRFRAGSVVLATNGYSHLLHPWFRDKIYPTRGQIIVTEPVPRFMAAPCYANFVLDYFRQLADGHVLIGGFRQLATDTERGTADVPNEVIHEALEAFLARHFAFLEGVKLSYRWAGIMGFSQDGLPMVGSLPSRPNVYFVGGFTAHGIGMAFRVGQLLARMMLHGEAVPYLSARRFA